MKSYPVSEGLSFLSGPLHWRYGLWKCLSTWDGDVKGSACRWCVISKQINVPCQLTLSYLTCCWISVWCCSISRCICCCLIPLFKTHKCSFPVCSCSTNQFQRSFLLNFSKFPEKLRQTVEGVFSLCWKPVSFCCSLRDIDIAFPWSAEFSQKTQSHTKQQPAAVTTKASTHQQHPTTSVT